MSDEVVQYLREHRATYTREALAAELGAAGYEPADVDAAWARLEAEDAATTPASDAPASYNHGLAAVLLMVFVAIAYLGSIAWFFPLFFSEDPGRYSVLVVLYTVAMLAGGAFVLRRMLRATTSGALAGAFLLAVATYVGLSGACVVGMTSLFRIYRP